MFILYRNGSEGAILKTERDEKLFDIRWKQKQFFFYVCTKATLDDDGV